MSGDIRVAEQQHEGNGRSGGTEALSQWINSVRTKKSALRKRGELRALAVLGRTLRRAEDELLRRQRARAVRWARLRPLLSVTPPPRDDAWQTELNKLDDFFKDLDSVLSK